MAKPPKVDPIDALEADFEGFTFDVEDLDETADESGDERMDRFELQEAMSNVGRVYSARRPDTTTDYSGLDKFGVSNYDVFFIGGSGKDNHEIAQIFFEQTVEKFRQLGAGTYDCVLYYRYGEMNADIMDRWSTAWRATVRRIRNTLSSVDQSVFVVLRYEIMADRRFAAVSLARMSPLAFNTYRAVRVREKQKVRSGADYTSLKNFI